MNRKLLELRAMLKRIERHDLSPAEGLQAFRRLQQSREAETSEAGLVYLQRLWERAEEHAASASPAAGPVLVFATDRLVSGQLESRLAGNALVISVTPGSRFRALAPNHYELQYGDPSEYQLLLDAVAQHAGVPQRILYHASAAVAATEQELLPRLLEQGVYSLLYLSQALLAQRLVTPVRLLYMYQGLPGQQKQEARVGHALHAAVGGFARSVRRENPRLLYQAVEVVPALGQQADERAVVDAALVEWQTDGSRAEVRYESGTRFVRVFHEWNDQRANRPALLRERGVYLITGGLSGLGYLVAEHLARRVRAKLVLAGRSPLGEAQAKKLQALEALGAEALYVQADVASRSDVARLMAEAIGRFGTVNGVIHSAGLIRDSLVMRKSAREMEAVLAVKVLGTLHLEEATQGGDVDFLALFSSITALAGNVGQADYAYANSFMDHYAEHLAREGQRRRVLTVNWSYWKEGGMQVGAEGEAQLQETFGICPLESARGLGAFDVCLRSDQTQLAVLQGDAERIRSAFAEAPQVPAATPATPGTRVPPSIGLRDQAVAYLQRLLADRVKLPPTKVKVDELLERYGIDSIMIMDLTRQLEKTFGVLSKTLFFEYRTIADLAGYFVENHAAKLRVLFGSAEQPQPAAPAAAQPASETAGLQRRTLARPASAERKPLRGRDAEDPIAIIGVSGQYPMARTLDQFWENLKAGRDCITEIPAERWDYRPFYTANRGEAGKSFSKWGGFIDHVDKFDPLFFQVLPTEAERMDPQERLFLQTAWSALEDAGCTRKGLDGLSVGVFVGAMYGHYQLFGAEQSLQGNPIALNSSFATIANRVSYLLNFRGPSMAVDTMCSSSLTAIHLACDSLRKGESDLALAGGVNVTIHPNKYLLLSQGNFVSSDGRCRSFGEGGDGYVPGEGCGAVLLKPLSKALQDGDQVYAVILASTLNHGGRTNGYTVPNPQMQADLIGRALRQAGVPPESISYVEAHGTGTSLGDPIEIGALAKAFGTERSQYCAIGSVKSNIGHLEAAAGIAGLTKVLLQLQHGQLVPSLHSERLNSHIDFSTTPFVVQQRLAEWTRPADQRGGHRFLRRAAISSFGAGGSNAHLIVEEFEPRRPGAEVRETGPQVVVVSARTEERLRVYVQNLLAFLSGPAPDETGREQVQRAMERWPGMRDLLQVLAEQTGLPVEGLETGETWLDFGLDGIGLAELAERLNSRYDLDLAAVELAALGSVSALAQSMRESWQAPAPIQHLPAPRNVALDDLAYTLQVGREAMEVRLAIVANSLDEVREKLTAFCEGRPDLAHVYRGTVDADQEKIALLSDGAEGNEYLRAVIAERKWDKVARLWAYGAHVPWELLYEHRRTRPARIALPTYPFALERYWVPGAGSAHRQSGAAAMVRLHPLLDRNSSTFEVQKFTTKLRADAVWLSDHVVDGQRLLPGAVCLEMARAAAELSGAPPVRSISRVAWIRPLILNTGETDVELRLYPSEDGVDFELVTAGAASEPVLHVEGRVSSGGPAEPGAPAALDLDAIRARCSRLVRSRPECYAMFERRGFRYGSSLRTLTEWRGGEGEALALLQWPDAPAEPQEGWGLHPSLLDGALQAVLGLAPGEQPRPFSLGRLDLYRPLLARCYAYVRRIGPENNPMLQRFQITLTDEDGRVLVCMNDFTQRGARSDKTERAGLLDLLSQLEKGALHVDDVERLVRDVM
jgi:acyl transferase domain-containing protein/NAD(P)-dependent dehydrogenase (short-subunit alcohol dehydrogenase family)/acyl carrier protein